MVIKAKLIIIFLIFFLKTSAQTEKLKVYSGIGYFLSDFNWSIAGNEAGTSPNILSELKWKNLEGITYNIGGNYLVNEKMEIAIDGRYGKIMSGQGNDSDFGSNNRQATFSSVDFLSNKGYDYAFNLLYKYNIISLNQINSKITIGYEQVGNKFTGVDLHRSIDNLILSYRNRWNGATIGQEITYRDRRFSTQIKYYFGLYAYSAKANWASNEAFQHPISFRQFALGMAHNSEIVFNYQLTPYLGVGIRGLFVHRFTRSGLDKAYLSDNTIHRTKFNGANSKQSLVFLHLNYLFN